MKRYFIISILSLLSSFCYGQGYGHVLFSSSGDTVLARTSFGNLGKNGIITTCFVINAKMANGIKKISVFTIDERKTKKHDVGYACANYNAISPDTAIKYNFKFVGALKNEFIKDIKIDSKIVQKTVVKLNGRKVRKNQVEYSFSLGEKLFLTETVWILKGKSKADKPRIDRVYYNPQIDKYYVVYFISDNYINKKTNSIITQNTRKEIII